MDRPIIIWHERDLRVDDHPALHAAAEQTRHILPVFIHAPSEHGDWSIGAAGLWWLTRSLVDLEKQYQKLGAQFYRSKGGSLEILRDLIASSGARAVYWIRRYEPELAARDAKVQRALEAAGIEIKIFEGNYLNAAEAITKGDGKPYAVYTPFWNAFQKCYEPVPPLPAPKGLKSPEVSIPTWDLPAPKQWAKGWEKLWSPGRNGALERLDTFAAGPYVRYQEDRDFLAEEGTSLFSPHLHFGEISAREIAWKLKDLPDQKAATSVLRQLVWREFGNLFLAYFPHTPLEPWRDQFQAFPWKDDPIALKQWQRGETGYPIVDAAMRQLWQTGWMHNRARMIVASFLVKDLLIPWQEGARWFWDTLVDADLGNNTLGWQWTAGCGPDAAPYFRIFNPILQGQRFDKDGAYIRRWVPELAHLPVKYLHEPWKADIYLDYPERMVDHSEARDAALTAFEKIKTKK